MRYEGHGFDVFPINQCISSVKQGGRISMRHPRLQRALFIVCALVLTAMAVVGCGSTSGGGQTTTTLTIYSSGDVNIQHLWKDILIPQYQKANPDTKFNLVFAEHGNTDTATLARVTAAIAQKKDPGMDIIDSGIVTQAVTANLLEPVTTQTVPSLSKVEPSLVQQ